MDRFPPFPFTIWRVRYVDISNPAAMARTVYTYTAACSCSCSCSAVRSMSLRSCSPRRCRTRPTRGDVPACVASSVCCPTGNSHARWRPIHWAAACAAGRTRTFARGGRNETARRNWRHRRRECTRSSTGIAISDRSRRRRPAKCWNGDICRSFSPADRSIDGSHSKIPLDLQNKPKERERERESKIYIQKIVGSAWIKQKW